MTMRTILLVAGLSACTPPEMATFTQLEVAVAEGAEPATAAFVELIDGAGDSLYAAVPAGEDTALTDAILRAWDRGVDVELVTDIDRESDAGIASLLEAGVPVTLADGGITYFDFNLNADVSWTSEQTMMTHAWAIADSQRVVAANRVGFLETGTRVVLSLRGEDLVEDLLSEHNQVFNGTDATATTAFSGLAKSIADPRWIYPTQTDLDLEMWFGPQERLTKRIVDATYGARASVWVMTDDFTNEGLAHALQAKADWGFDVQVVVGPNFGSSNSMLSGDVLEIMRDVEIRQVTDVDHVPTVVLVDYLDARDGLHHPSKAFVLTHDLFAASRLYRGAEVVTDQLIDGTLWVLDDYQALSPEMLTLHDAFVAHFDRGGDL